MSCYGCGKNFSEEYSEQLKNQEITLSELPEEITKDIHIISYETKIRLEEPDSDGDYYTYGIGHKNVCKKCLVCTIHNYYNQNNRLPYLRRDVYWFKSPDTSEYEKIKDTYILPKRYHIYYYRQKEPEITKEGYKKIN